MGEVDKKYLGFEPGDEKLVAMLVEDNYGWACSIAKSVARSWNLDWQLDGLDGGAYEGLLFCAQRFDAKMGVPFRGYARRRIHEASTAEARNSKNWKQGVSAGEEYDSESREVSARLFEIFPSLREGILPVTESDGENSIRESIRQLLSSASVIASSHQARGDDPSQIAEQRQMLEFLGELDDIHQLIIWQIYWQDKSMRGLADEWELDELVIIREHKKILDYVHSFFAEGRIGKAKKPRVRPGLRPLAQKLRNSGKTAPFVRQS